MGDLIGQSVGRYRILEQLGVGGMATVYKAYDTRLENEVAVKVIRTERLVPEHTTKTLMRFEREVRALAKLTHPNIVKVIDFGEEDGRPYLVMPYLAGGTLKQQLQKGSIPWQKALNIIIPIAKALKYSHGEGIIHRDVKSSNILITRSGEPMLTDFGVAKIFDVEETVDLTGTGMGIGTPEYMAPEQFQGVVDQRVDIYALGVVLYEMVTGRKPYIADTPAAVIAKQLTEPLPRPTKFVPDLPEKFELVLLKALAKQPGDRFQSMEEFIIVLNKLANDQVIDAKKELKLSNEISTGKSDAKYKLGAEKITRKKQKSQILLGITIVTILAMVFLSLQLSKNVSSLAAPDNTAVAQSPTLFLPTKTQTPRPTATITLTPTSTPGVGTSLTREQDGMMMKYIPAGEFTMGDAEKAGYSVKVYLDAFWMDETEITNAMYAICVQSGVCTQPENVKYFNDQKFENHPVVWVNWYDAQIYCEWAASRLPTEAEWEKAARGGLEGMHYPWGNEKPTCELGAENGAGIMACGGTNSMPVASFSANGYGLYDMAGNVEEWVADWYSDTYPSTLTDGIRNPIGPTTGTSRATRGGAWSSFVSNIGVFFRYSFNFPPTNSDQTDGFRCARTP